jgi:hypothetical protein
MALKQALGPALMAAMPIVPIYLFQESMKAKYLQAYTDAALLQTSLLDGWDTTEETAAERREEFRRFLVDAHKAAYVPVCIAGTDTDHFITAGTYGYECPSDVQWMLLNILILTYDWLPSRRTGRCDSASLRCRPRSRP